MTAPLLLLAFLAGGWCVVCAIVVLGRCALGLLLRMLTGPVAP